MIIIPNEWNVSVKEFTTKFCDIPNKKLKLRFKCYSEALDCTISVQTIFIDSVDSIPVELLNMTVYKVFSEKDATVILLNEEVPVDITTGIYNREYYFEPDKPLDSWIF